MTGSPGSRTWRVIDLINWGTDYFRNQQFDHSRTEIEWLLCGYLQCKRIDLYLRFEEPFSNRMLQEFKALVKRRLTYEPLQYIFGETEFFGLTLAVTPQVLIPRPESERLVEVALELIPEDRETRILDVGTGSGCLALALAKQRPAVKIIAVDNSPEAVEITVANAEKNSVSNLEVLTLDITTDTPAGEFDLIISNPPYIPAAEMDDLMPEVKEFEPAQALTDGHDGLDFYRRLAEIAPRLVKSGGGLVLEVGRGDHPARAKKLFDNQSFEKAELIRDYNGDDRVLKIVMKPA